MAKDLRPVLKKRLQRFHKRLKNLLECPSTERVHAFRIASRELLACHPLLIAISPAQRWHKTVRKSLKRLNQLRDLQQMQERLANQPVFSLPLAKKICKAEKRWNEYGSALRAPEFFIALSQTEKSLIAKTSLSSASSLLLVNSYQQWKRILQRVAKRLKKVDAENLDSLHRLRVSYKELRYLVELWLEAGIPLSIDIKNLKMWQELLGEVTDFRIMARISKKLAFSPTVQLGFQLQAQQNAQLFMARREEFSAFLEAIDQQVIQYFDGGK